MAQREIEVILLRQLASYLAMPIFLVDKDGTLIFYNEPAEALLGQRFEDTGEMPASQWAPASTPTLEDGSPLPADELPLTVALRERQPAHLRVCIEGHDHIRRCIEAVA